MRRLIVIAAAAALALPAGASANTLHGTVVHRIGHAHSFVVASRSGALRAVHSARRPALGRQVTVRARHLANGTYAARAVTLSRRTRRHARLRGVVTHVDRAQRAFVLSARGVSLVVQDSSTPMPAEGRTVVVDTTLSGNGDGVEADDVQETGDASTFEVEGIVKAVDQAAETLTVSADDDDQLGTDVVVTFPAGTDLSSYAPGSEVELRVTRNPDGTLSAVSGSRDGEQGDDGQGDQQRQGSDGQDGHDQQSGSTASGDGGSED